MLNNSCTNDGAKLVKLCEFRKKWGKYMLQIVILRADLGKLSGNEA
jgi:hypothetical protein